MKKYHFKDALKHFQLGWQKIKVNINWSIIFGSMTLPFIFYIFVSIFLLCSIRPGKPSPELQIMGAHGSPSYVFDITSTH